MKTRPLHIERLERRELLTADIWPQGVGYAADLFNNAGAGLSNRGYGPGQAYLGATSVDLITSNTSLTKATLIGNSSDLNGALLYPDGQARFPAAFWQGGFGNLRRSIGTPGREAFQAFVNAGGTYFGSCNGAYVTAHYWGLNMGSNGSAKGSQTMSLADVPDHHISQFMLEHGVSDLLVHNVSHIGGPRFGYNRSQPPNTLQYGTIIATRGVTASRGTPMLMEHQPHEDSGWVLISSSHPEYARNNSQTIFAAAWLDYAITLGSRTPALKGELEFGQSVQMVGATEKVGDGQYHRWTTTIPEGIETLVISLSGLRANADLYVQRDGYAHEQSYSWSSTLPGRATDTIVIENPEPGTYEISVRGTHSVLNGAAYTLTVDDTIPEIIPTWPQGIGFAADMFVNGGVHLGGYALARETAFLGWTSETLLTNSAALTRETLGGNTNDINGALLYPDGQPRFPIMYVNGGQSYKHGPAIGEAGRQAVYDFVTAGGSYSGSCAGAFSIQRERFRSPLYGIWDGTLRDSGGNGSQTVSFVGDAEHPIAEFLAEHGVTSLTVSGILHAGGPRFTTPNQPEGTNFVGVVTSASRRIRNTIGTPFVLEYQKTPQHGMIAVIPSHPEHSSKPEQVVLMAAVLQHAANHAKKVPDLKGELQFGQSVSMVAPHEKLGDKQYHRWTVNVPEGTPTLTITLSGMSDNADLFVQHSGYAHEHSYLAASTLSGTATDAVVIPNPAPGVYEVSIRGTHSVLNGAAYTLTIGDAVLEAEGESRLPVETLVTTTLEPITLPPDQPLEANEERQELFASLVTTQEQLVYRPLPVVAVDAIMTLGLLA